LRNARKWVRRILIDRGEVYAGLLMNDTVRAVVDHRYKLSGELLLNAKQPVERIGILRTCRERIHDLCTGRDRRIGRWECNGISTEERVENIRVVTGVGRVIR